MKCLSAIGAVCFGAAACATQPVSKPAEPPPAFLLGDFTDDYGSRYHISAAEWRQGSGMRYHVLRWSVAGQYLIARNDSSNTSDGGRWTRIDWLPLPGMPPYEWGYCYSEYDAVTAAGAESTMVAQRSAPRTGCNGFPFSRMRRATAPPARDGSPRGRAATSAARGATVARRAPGVDA